MPDAPPELDVVGPTIADDVRRLIRKYGRSALKEAVQKQTKLKRGVKAKPDWFDLEEILKEDAARWLDGGNPFRERGNRTIAKKIAADQPGHNIDATFDRIRKKLIKDRRYYTLVHAARLSEDHYPHMAHLKALQALAGLGRHDVWADQLHSAQNALVDYSIKYGTPPHAMTISEIQAEASKALRAEPAKGDRNVLQVLLRNRHT